MQPSSNPDHYAQSSSLEHQKQMMMAAQAAMYQSSSGLPQFVSIPLVTTSQGMPPPNPQMMSGGVYQQKPAGQQQQPVILHQQHNINSDPNFYFINPQFLTQYEGSREGQRGYYPPPFYHPMMPPQPDYNTQQFSRRHIQEQTQDGSEQKKEGEPASTGGAGALQSTPSGNRGPQAIQDFRNQFMLKQQKLSAQAKGRKVTVGQAVGPSEKIKMAKLSHIQQQLDMKQIKKKVAEQNPVKLKIIKVKRDDVRTEQASDKPLEPFDDKRTNLTVPTPTPPTEIAQSSASIACSSKEVPQEMSGRLNKPPSKITLAAKHLNPKIKLNLQQKGAEGAQSRLEALAFEIQSLKEKNFDLASKLHEVETDNQELMACLEKEKEQFSELQSSFNEKLQADVSKHRADDAKKWKGQLAKYEEMIQRLKSIQEAKNGSKSDKKMLADARDQLMLSKSNLISVVKAFINLFKYLISRCIVSQQNQQFGGGATSLSNYSHINPLRALNHAQGLHGQAMEGTIFSNSSLTMTENLMDKSFDDDKRNLFEQLKLLLIAKLQGIQKTVKGINLQKEIDKITDWNFEALYPIQQTASPAAEFKQKSNNKSFKSRFFPEDKKSMAPSHKYINTVRTQYSYRKKDNDFIMNRAEDPEIMEQTNFPQQISHLQDNNSLIMGSFENFDQTKAENSSIKPGSPKKKFSNHQNWARRKSIQFSATPHNALENRALFSVTDEVRDCKQSQHVHESHPSADAEQQSQTSKDQIDFPRTISQFSHLSQKHQMSEHMRKQKGFNQASSVENFELHKKGDFQYSRNQTGVNKTHRSNIFIQEPSTKSFDGLKLESENPHRNYIGSGSFFGLLQNDTQSQGFKNDHNRDSEKFLNNKSINSSGKNTNEILAAFKNQSDRGCKRKAKLMSEEEKEPSKIDIQSSHSSKEGKKNHSCISISESKAHKESKEPDFPKKIASRSAFDDFDYGFDPFVIEDHYSQKKRAGITKSIQQTKEKSDSFRPQLRRATFTVVKNQTLIEGSQNLMSKTNHSHTNENISEDDVVSFENFRQPTKSRNEAEETLGANVPHHGPQLGTLGPVNLKKNTLVGSDGYESPDQRSNNHGISQDRLENESDLPIFGQQHSERGQTILKSEGSSIYFGRLRNSRGGSTRNLLNNNDKLNNSGTFADHRGGEKGEDYQRVYGSFGSFGSCNSPRHSQSSQKQNLMENLTAKSGKQSNDSVEVQMRKSSKSANMNLNKSNEQKRRYSGLSKTNKAMKQRSGLINHFRDNGSLGNAEETKKNLIDSSAEDASGSSHDHSHKEAHLISQLGRGAHSVHSGYSFQQPVDTEVDLPDRDNGSQKHSNEKPKYFCSIIEGEESGLHPNFTSSLKKRYTDQCLPQQPGTQLINSSEEKPREEQSPVEKNFESFKGEQGGQPPAEDPFLE